MCGLLTASSNFFFSHSGISIGLGWNGNGMRWSPLGSLFDGVEGEVDACVCTCGCDCDCACDCACACGCCAEDELLDEGYGSNTRGVKPGATYFCDLWLFALCFVLGL